MAKILSRSGDSLADTYNVVGSVAGIEQLESREVTLVHEMGGTIFSERLSGAIRRGTTGLINQDTTWDVILTDLPAGPSRIFGVMAFTSVTTRLAEVTILVREPVDGREIPIFAWEAGGGEIAVRMQDDGDTVATRIALQSTIGMATLPSMLIGLGQPQPVHQIAFRGLTSGFGAGQVRVTFVVYIGFSQIGGISSRGLPIPGW